MGRLVHDDTFRRLCRARDFLAAAGPRIQQEDVESIKKLVGKGAFGAGVFDTADCRKTYEELKARGVEFLAPPKEEFYGVQAVFRDPFGNWFSLTEPKNQ